MEQTKQTFQLPLGIVSRVDVGRLLRELTALDTFMKSAEVRTPGSPVQLPKTSKLLDEFLEVNKKSALKTEDRDEVSKFLSELRKDAPTIHMSFSADPSPLFTQKLITWLRQNIHPALLLQVGLQPAIGAGAIVRTTNKYFDLSLREFFASKKSVLLAKMRSTNEEEVKSEATTETKDAEAATQAQVPTSDQSQSDASPEKTAVLQTAPAQQPQAATPIQETPNEASQ